MRNGILIAGAASVLLAAGCATTPENLPALDRAEHAVAQLEHDPLASQSASRELQNARDALAKANEAWKASDPRPEVQHLAYVAERHAQIGAARLSELRARQQIARGEAERNAVLLEAREREARLAASAAEVNAQNAEAARRAALLAQQRAQSNLQQLHQAQQELADMQAKQTERGMVLTLGDVLFDTDEAKLKPGAAPTLDRLARFLQNNEGTRVMVEGYTDSRGTEQYNQDLSDRRATAVADALESRGVPRDRINVAGRGESLPVASNDTPAGRQRNRRVEIVFSDESGKFDNDIAQHEQES